MQELEIIFILAGLFILPIAIWFAFDNMQFVKVFCGFLFGASLCTTVAFTWLWCERLNIMPITQATLLIASGIVIASSLIGCIYYGRNC